MTYNSADFQRNVFLGKTIFRPAAMVADFEAEPQGGFRFADVSPEKSVAMWKFPILLIYGLHDHNIPQRGVVAAFTAAAGQGAMTRSGCRIQKGPECGAESPQRVIAFFASAHAAD